MNAYAEPTETVETVVIDQTQRHPMVMAAPPARDVVTPLLPPTPKGREFGRLADQAKRIGERLGAVVTGDGSSKAIYSFPAGNGRIEGPTIWLIGALWQEYGHVVVDSETREERGGRVAISTTIVDRINGTAYRREHHTSIAPPPAKFARKPDQVERWNTMQIQSAISKAERTTVQHFLPGWYVDIAVEAARDAFGRNVLGKNADGSARSLAQAIADALGAFERDFKVTQAMLEDFLSAERPLWTLSDFSEVRALYAKLKRGEATVGGIFGDPEPAKPSAAPQPSGLDGLAGDAKPAAAPAAAPAPAPAAAPAPSPAPARARKAAAAPAAPAAAPAPSPAAAAPAADASPEVDDEPKANSPEDVGARPAVSAPAPAPRGFEPPRTLSPDELASAGKA